MVEPIYLTDMYQKEFEAEVVSVTDGKFIVLNQTAFYPKSGGVANDQGLITRDNDEFNVVYVGKFSGKISHEVDKPGLKVGDKIIGKLDWDRRYTLMRYHTAAHVLSGAFYLNLKAKITGNEISVDQGRVDFNLENFDRVLIEQEVNNSNRIISKDHSVEVYSLDRKEVEADPDLTKLAMGLPKNIQKIRIVDIKTFDRQPDGGCHVRSLKEIGNIKIKKLVNKGKNNRRLYFTIES
ncbi:alanyl-tRNA editing protein AlaX [Candidatus Heimdallarchaeota archaeon B3_Heim]|nr:MAG: alanyl-tRNA editing protein AlaX [Candidatus Heimdallarchaeota archaeon B3_Heim]